MLFTDQTFVILPKRPSRNLWPIVAQGICSLVLIWSKPRWTAAPNTWGNWVAVLKQKALTILATPKMPLSTAEESRALSFQPACLLSLSQLPLSTAYANTYTTSLVSFLAFCVFSQILHYSREVVEVFVPVCVHSEQCHGLFTGVINCAHSHVRYLSLTSVSFLLDVF